jgi:hypothetical protein
MIKQKKAKDYKGLVTVSPSTKPEIDIIQYPLS